MTEGARNVRQKPGQSEEVLELRKKIFAARGHLNWLDPITFEVVLALLEPSAREKGEPRLVLGTVYAHEEVASGAGRTDPEQEASELALSGTPLSDDVAKRFATLERGDDFTNQAQSQSGSTNLASAGVLPPIERLEDLGQIRLPNPISIVFNR